MSPPPPFPCPPPFPHPEAPGAEGVRIKKQHERFRKLYFIAPTRTVAKPAPARTFSQPAIARTVIESATARTVAKAMQ